MKIGVVSRLAREKLVSKSIREKVMWKAQAENWRVKCQAAFREYFARKAISRGTHETLYLEDFKCNFFTYHSYYIYSHYPQKWKGGYAEENLRKVSTTHTPLLERATHPWVRIP